MKLPPRHHQPPISRINLHKCSSAMVFYCVVCLMAPACYWLLQSYLCSTDNGHSTLNDTVVSLQNFQSAGNAATPIAAAPPFLCMCRPKRCCPRTCRSQILPPHDLASNDALSSMPTTNFSIALSCRTIEKLRRCQPAHVTYMVMEPLTGFFFALQTLLTLILLQQHALLEFYHCVTMLTMGE